MNGYGPSVLVVCTGERIRRTDACNKVVSSFRARIKNEWFIEQKANHKNAAGLDGSFRQCRGQLLQQCTCFGARCLRIHVLRDGVQILLIRKWGGDVVVVMGILPSGGNQLGKSIIQVFVLLPHVSLCSMYFFSKFQYLEFEWKEGD